MIKDKIKTRKSLSAICSRLKEQGKKIVFTNGCFDILHYGHVQYLEDAKKYGDILIVGVNTDSSVKRLKGPLRPIIPEGDRIKTVAALESVDYTVLFPEDTPMRLIASLKPNILIKGADWDKKDIIGAAIVSRHGGKVIRIKILKGRSTTTLIKTIVEKNRRRK
jgi:rfaE bifunctional protein nucleotidyltransferase chain/domain